MVQGLITESVLVFLRKTMKMLKIDLKILGPFEIFQEKKNICEKSLDQAVESDKEEEGGREAQIRLWSDTKRNTDNQWLQQ